MATRYIPKNPTGSIVNGQDMTNPLFIPRYTLNSCRVTFVQTRLFSSAILRGRQASSVPSFTVSIVNNSLSPVSTPNTPSSA